MKLPRLVPPLVILGVAGCTNALTGPGSTVRFVEDKAEHDCKYISVVTAYDEFGLTPAENTENALNKLRNNAGDMQANAVKILDIDTTDSGTTASAEALRCTFTDWPPGLGTIGEK